MVTLCYLYCMCLVSCIAESCLSVVSIFLFYSDLILGSSLLYSENGSIVANHKVAGSILVFLIERKKQPYLAIFN